VLTKNQKVNLEQWLSHNLVKKKISKKTGVLLKVEKPEKEIKKKEYEVNWMDKKEKK
jgi:hypothetical protein